MNTYSPGGNGVVTCTLCPAGYGTATTGTTGTSVGACDVCAAGYGGSSVSGKYYPILT
jgi:hypothetical protein